MDLFEVPALSNEFPWIYPHVFSHLLPATFELGYFEFPAISNSSFFPCTLNQPRYFELVKNRVQEQTPKRPRKTEVRQKIETPSRYSLFTVEGAEIGRGANKPVVIHDRQKY